MVVGNGAQGQLQLGGYGDLFDVVHAYVDDGNPLDAETGRLLASIADRVCDNWQRPDSGMWELVEHERYTSPKLGCWQALDYAVHLVELGQLPGGSALWAAERERIRAWVQTDGWSETRQSYVMYPGSERLDASVLLHAASGFDRGERMSATIDAIDSELGRGLLVYRYSGMQREGHLLACAFWMEEAKARMGELVTLGNDVGFYVEMMNAENNEFLGNLPHGLSHLALIYAAITIDVLLVG